jgi:hypothetical protein
MNQVAFINYMMDFYGPRGVYPQLDFTATEVMAALRIYLRTNPEFCGDSIDRERVRDIVLEQRG